MYVDVTNHFLLPSIYTSSIRSPIHRFVSQYNFECLEHRGCTAKSIHDYWTRRSDLYNIYTSTFSDTSQQRLFYYNNTKQYPQAAKRRSEVMEIAFDTIVQFHLLLIMEWFYISEIPVQHVLHFTNTSLLVQPNAVRPHNNHKKRTYSIQPNDILSPELYQQISESLALDEILYDISRRLFLERLVCKTY